MRLELSRLEEVVTARSRELEAHLRSSDPLSREGAGLQLGGSGAEGARVLAAVAVDEHASLPSRITALRYLPPGPHAVSALGHGLADTDPVLRLTAIERVGVLGVIELLPAVETLCGDRATVWDLDMEFNLGEAATAVADQLRLGPRPPAG